MMYDVNAKASVYKYTLKTSLTRTHFRGQEVHKRGNNVVSSISLTNLSLFSPFSLPPLQATLFRGMKGLKGIGSKLKKKKKDPDSYSRAEFPGNQSVNEEEEEAPDSDEDVCVGVCGCVWVFGNVGRHEPNLLQK